MKQFSSLSILICCMLLSGCGTPRKGQWCVYEIAGVEGKCKEDIKKSFCISCRDACPNRFDTTIVRGKDTCHYTLVAIDKNCKTCPPNSLP